jgi:hypothetical protein
MPTLKQVPAAVRFRARKALKTQLVSHRRVPRYAYRHYYIEDDGLHTRVHMQNFYSTMWPHLEETVSVRVEAFDAAGRSFGVRHYELAPFGALFLDVRDLLEALGATSSEGTVLVDAAPPQSVLDDLTSFPLPDQWELIMGTPFWMAYSDAHENYMYVHAISPEMGKFYGVPAPVGRLLMEGAEEQSGSWRAGRLIDVAGLADLQIVLINHAAGTRKPTVGVYDSDDDTAVWEMHSVLGPHEVRRFRVPAESLASFAARKPNGRFRVGVAHMPTSNGKPYLLMRYGDGPLSLHHG